MKIVWFILGIVFITLSVILLGQNNKVLHFASLYVALMCFIYFIAKGGEEKEKETWEN